jgi:glycosyltransferase involved in cell wall biosynthesis
MNILFVHSNFPAQFVHLASYLAQAHNVVAIGGPSSRAITAVRLLRYRLSRGSTAGILPLAIRYEADCLRGAATAAACSELLNQGFRPDLVVGHSGWGELLFVKEIWPDAKIIAYAEYYYRGRGGDSCFDREIDDPTLANIMVAHAKNGGLAVSLADADLAISPTHWQRSCFPALLRSRIVVAHDGIDTVSICPNPTARVQLANGCTFGAGDELVSYVNRSLEPMRGIHVFLRALPAILRARPSAQVLIIGASTETPYGKPAAQGTTWKEAFLKEICDEIDPSRVHWLGAVDRTALNAVLAVSRVHVYLTYPFVLSWSLLEAMSAGCLVVASDTAPVREVIDDGSNGLLVDFFDHDLLASTVIEALARPFEAVAGMRLAARKTIVKRFDRDSVCLPRLDLLIKGMFPS